MKKKILIIVGSLGHAKVVIDIFEKQNSHNILGLLNDYRKINQESLKYKVIGGIKNIKEIISKYNHLMFLLLWEIIGQDKKLLV